MRRSQVLWPHLSLWSLVSLFVCFSRFDIVCRSCWLLSIGVFTIFFNMNFWQLAIGSLKFTLVTRIVLSCSHLRQSLLPFLIFKNIHLWVSWESRLLSLDWEKLHGLQLKLLIAAPWSFNTYLSWLLIHPIIIERPLLLSNKFLKSGSCIEVFLPVTFMPVFYSLLTI